VLDSGCRRKLRCERGWRCSFRIVARAVYDAYDVIGIVEGSNRLRRRPGWHRRDAAGPFEHKAILLETYPHERQEGRLLTGLAKRLAPHVALKPRPADTIYDRTVLLKQVDDFSKLLGTFVRRFKSGGYSLQDCEIKSDCARPARHRPRVELAARFVRGEASTSADISTAEKMSDRFVRWMRQLAWLAPDVLERLVIQRIARSLSRTDLVAAQTCHGRSRWRPCSGRLGPDGYRVTQDITFAADGVSSRDDLPVRRP
jgi:hypothetical protein